MGAIYKREVKSYFSSMLGCVMIALTLAFIGFFVVILNVRGLRPNFEYSLVFSVEYWVFTLIIPFITMRSIAEERHSKTEQLLLSLPIPICKIVLAKYFAMLTVIGTPVVITGIYPIIYSLFSQTKAVNFSTAYNGWFLLLLVVAAMTAVGMFISSLVENQIIAAVLSVGVFFILSFMSTIAYAIPGTPAVSLVACILLAAVFGALVLAMTKNSTAACIATGVPSVVMLIIFIVKKSLFSGLFPSILNSLSFFDYYIYGGALLGYFDVKAVVFYISFIFVFVFMTVEFMERRRYN